MAPVTVRLQESCFPFFLVLLSQVAHCPPQSALESPPTFKIFRILSSMGTDMIFHQHSEGRCSLSEDSEGLQNQSLSYGLPLPFSTSLRAYRLCWAYPSTVASIWCQPLLGGMPPKLVIGQRGQGVELTEENAWPSLDLWAVFSFYSYLGLAPGLPSS